MKKRALENILSRLRGELALDGWSVSGAHLYRAKGDWCQVVELENGSDPECFGVKCGVTCLAQRVDYWVVNPSERVRTPAGREWWTMEDASDLARAIAAASPLPLYSDFSDQQAVDVACRNDGTSVYPNYFRAVVAIRSGQIEEAQKFLALVVAGAHPQWPIVKDVSLIQGSLAHGGLAEAQRLVDEFRGHTQKSLKLSVGQGIYR